jgi:hypothetical protein
MNNIKRMSMLAGAALAALALSGCASNAGKPAASTRTTSTPVAASTAKEFYVVLPEDGRYYAFGDHKNYFDYLSHGEVTLTRTKIGVGPNGKTVVFGITKDDVKSSKPSLGELVYNDALEAAPEFHGEVFKNGRYYVFGDLKDMKSFAAFGEVPYSYTDIGAGPKGETLVWVMNKASYKKGRPAATIARFSELRAAK